MPHITTPREREMTMPNETSQAQKDNYYIFISLNLIKVEIRMEKLGRRGDKGVGKWQPVVTEEKGGRVSQYSDETSKDTGHLRAAREALNIFITKK